MKTRFFLLILICSIQVNSYAQKRQSDSLRIKQELYWAKLKEDAQKAIEKKAREDYQKKANVVSYDSKGNKVETQKHANGETVTVTTIKKPSVLNRPFRLDTIDKDSIFIKVFKSKQRMQIYHKRVILTAYKCVLGANSKEQKQQEGDRRTPEGIFKILTSKQHEKWDLFMLLDYPNEESLRIFEENKSKGLVAKTARVGGLVGIHGIWDNGDNVIDLKHNWTDGCVSLKNKDIEELAKLIIPGYTYIQIVP